MAYQIKGDVDVGRDITVGSKVGVGTTSPSSRLQVVSADNNVGTLIGGFYAANLSQGIGFGYSDVSNVGVDAILILNRTHGMVGVYEGSPVAQLHVTAYAAARKAFVVRGAASQTATLQEWQASNGTALSVVDATGKLGVGIIAPISQFHVQSATTATITSIVQGFAAQTANLTQWQDSTTAVLASVGILGESKFSGQTLGIRTVTSAPTLTAADYTVLCDATSAGFTVALPAASTSSGRILNIKKIDSTVNTVTIDPNASELIDGAATSVIGTQWTSLQIQCTGTGWAVI